MPLPKMIEGCEHTLLRVLRYPPLTGKEEPGALRAAPHGRYHLLTLLPAANEPGLQVLGKDGNWNDVPCDFGLFDRQHRRHAARGLGPLLPVHRAPGAEPHRRGPLQVAHSLPQFLHPRREVVLSERYTVQSYFDERHARAARQRLTPFPP